MFLKHQNKAEFRNLVDSAVISSNFPGLRTFAASMTSTASTTSVASMTSTASFHQKMTDPDDLIIPSTQVTNTSPFLWNGSSVAIFGRLRPIWSFQLVQVGIWSALFILSFTTFFGNLPFFKIDNSQKFCSKIFFQCVLVEGQFTLF